MEKIEKILEKYVIYVLPVLMTGIIVLATIDRVRNIMVAIVINGPLGVDQLMRIFGGILIILIGIDLAVSMQAYLHDHIVHVKLVYRDRNLAGSVRIAAENKIYAYDAYLISCARKHNEPLITLDKKMIEIAESIGIIVVKVG